MKILSVATAWGSAHGGLNVFNYRLCCALSRAGHNVICYVLDRSTDDVVDALRKEVELVLLTEPPHRRWTDDAIGHIDSSLVESVDAIIIHDRVSAPFLGILKSLTVEPTIVGLIHTSYKDSDYFSGDDDDEIARKVREQISLIESSNLVFTSGPWLRDRITKEVLDASSVDKIHSLVPGREDLVEPARLTNRNILTFGRLSLDEEDKKGAAPMIKAFEQLIQRRDFDVSNLELTLVGADVDSATRQIQRSIVLRNGGFDKRIYFPKYEKYYDFRDSAIIDHIRNSSVVAVPSVVEAFGLTCLESVALGVPLIAPRQSGFHDIIAEKFPSHYQSIRWLSPEDQQDLPTRLSLLIQLILENFEECSRKATLLRDAVIDDWPTWDDAARTVAQEIERVCHSSTSTLEVHQTAEPSDSPFSVLDPLLPEKETNEDIAEKGQKVAVADASQEGVGDRSPLADLIHVCYPPHLVEADGVASALKRRYEGKHCTELQQQLLETIQGRKRVESFQDILLCGSTSSGKTTASEILFGISGDDDLESSRIVYLAPTRALAQERWREWQELFRDLDLDRTTENVIISTGEDHANDRDLARGDFLIACLVFEKANVVLSTSPALVSRLSMVVIDELHMISDIHRGPIIETLLAKVQNEKYQRQTRDQTDHSLRVVGITTEDGSLDDIKKFFTVVDLESDEDIPPLVAVQADRPVATQHHLVLPRSSGDCSYTLTSIKQFDIRDKLKMTAEEFHGVSRNVRQLPKLRNADEFERRSGRKSASADKYTDFLVDWIRDHPTGKRLLAFIGSKNDQSILADRLQSRIKKIDLLANRPRLDTELSYLHRLIENDDSSVDLDVPRRCLSQSVFIHNADINRSLRFAIEEYLSSALPAGVASEVILATETLSYGVNLAIDDVAILSGDFPASERNQELGARPKRLSQCAYRNMCGRAGRLNQGAASANVYFWPMTQDGPTPNKLLRHFYSDNERIRSRLFHPADREAYKKLDRDKERRYEAPSLFTYPLVRTVLDGLRYIGGAPGLVGPRGRSNADLDDVDDDFLRHLLFHSQSDENKTNLDVLRESVNWIVTGSAASELELVKKVGDGYKITALGSSIIDTGTEISTLKPIKASFEILLKEASGSIGEFPVELLLLVVLVQNEAHRQVLFGMPEFTTDIASDANRQSLLDHLASQFAHLGFDETVIELLNTYLAKCDEAPQHASQGETTSRAAHDACLRLFIGLLMWVSGSAVSDINQRLASIGSITGRKTTVRTNFASFAERISWKLIFLIEVMKHSKNSPNLRMLYARTRRLVARLRLGCAEEGLPFLTKTGPDESKIGRLITNELLAAGATPKAVVSGAFDLAQYSPTRQSRIRQQLRKFIVNSFLNLKKEFLFNASREGDEGELLEQYWNYAYQAILAISSGDSIALKWSEIAPAEGSIVIDPFGPGEDQTGEIEIRTIEGGLCIEAREQVYVDDERVKVESAKYIVSPRHDVNVAPLRRGGYVALVIDFPWLLDGTASTEAAIRMSPAAFGVFITLVARGFLRDAIEALKLIGKINRPISTDILLNELYTELRLAQFPEALFDAWTGYWDAD